MLLPPRRDCHLKTPPREDYTNLSKLQTTDKYYVTNYDGRNRFQNRFTRLYIDYIVVRCGFSFQKSDVPTQNLTAETPSGTTVLNR